MDDKLLQNAKIVLEAACRAKPGETVLMVADEKLLPYAPALASAAVELGLVPAIMDITHFLSSLAYDEGRCERNGPGCYDRLHWQLAGPTVSDPRRRADH